jgi:hypothetical protein
MATIACAFFPKSATELKVSVFDVPGGRKMDK